jgi:hypothetical protein
MVFFIITPSTSPLLNPLPFAQLQTLVTIIVSRLDRSGPCWLLKLRWMGSQRVQMKGLLPWLVRWACRAGTRDFCSDFGCPIVGPVKDIFIQFFCTHRPASWPGSHAGSPVS